jgi:hypothetical protein
MSNRNTRRPATPATATPAKSNTTRAKASHGRARRVVILPPNTAKAPALPAPQAATDADRADAIEVTATPTETAQEATTATDATAEQLAPVQTIGVPANVLLALLAVAPLKDSRHYLNGVYFHQTGAELRMVATDGHRMLVITHAAPEPIEWATREAGCIIPAAELARVVKFAGKDAVVKLSYGIGHPAATLEADIGSFKVRPIDGQFPVYQRVLDDAGAAFSAEREPMQASGMNAKFVKSAGAVSAALESDALFCFAPADDKAPTVFTFAGFPGAILVIMPMRDMGQALKADTVRLIGDRGMASSIAALKAHETRNRKAAKDAKSQKETDRLVKVADEYRARIEAIVSSLKPALPAPAPAASEEQADAA